MRKPPENMKLTSYEELLGMDTVASNENRNNDFKVVNAPLAELFEPKNHPYRVIDDEKMEETAESIRSYGVLVPGIARPRAEGGYELIAGNRRKRGSELAGKAEMPVIVRELDDDEAVIIMVDSNIQRENLLYSEKALAYKLKMEAMSHQGAKNGNGIGMITADAVGEKAGESGRTVQRYIRLTQLLPELLNMVDAEKIKFTPAVDISYLTEEEQSWVLDCIGESGSYPTSAMAASLKQHHDRGEITKAMVEVIMVEEKKESIKVTLAPKKIQNYFPNNYTKEQIETVIYELLEDWKKAQ